MKFIPIPTNQFDRLKVFNREVAARIRNLTGTETLTLTNLEPENPYTSSRHSCMVSGTAFVSSMTSDVPEYWHVQKSGNPTGKENLDHLQWYRVIICSEIHYICKINDGEFLIFWWTPISGSPAEYVMQVEDIYQAVVRSCLQHKNCRIAKEIYDAT